MEALDHHERGRPRHWSTVGASAGIGFLPEHGWTARSRQLPASLFYKALDAKRRSGLCGLV